MSKILTIYSSEEQIGKTTLGINLGASLIDETRKTVVLVDIGADDDLLPAWSLLKFAHSQALGMHTFSGEQVQAHLQRHSSQLVVLTVNVALTAQEAAPRGCILGLIEILQASFDYIIFDIASRLNLIAYEIIDESDVFIVVASSLEYEQPIGTLGHPNLRLVINMHEAPVESSLQQRPIQYVLPKDEVTVEAFRKSGIPFVIQSPYRPISKLIGRLARDIGEKQFGLALSGGAALGLAQLGILEVLEQNRIAIDMITGVSFGAFLGAAYAAGHELRRIKHHVIAWGKSACPISKWCWRRWFQQQFFQENTLAALCDTFLKDIYFEELSIPLTVVAIDARTGAGVVFREGKVLDAITSSMRIPGLFIPFKHTEPHLIDGSVIYPTPVFPLTQMGAHVTIGVIVTPSPAESQMYFRQKTKGRLTPEQRAARENYALVTATFDSLMERLIDTLDSPNMMRQGKPDLFITPKIAGVSWRDFQKVEELIEFGARAAEAMIPAIEKLKWG